MAKDTGIEWTDSTWNPIRGCSRVSKGCSACYAETMAARFCGEGQPYEGLITKGKWNGNITFVDKVLDQPLRWTKPRKIFVNSMSDLFHENVSFEEIASIFAVMMASTEHVFQILTKRPERMLDWFKWLEAQGPAAAERWQTDIVLKGRAARAEIGWTKPDGSDIVAEYEVSPERCALLWSGDAKLAEIGSKKSANASVHKDTGWPLPNVHIGVSAEDQATANTRIPLLLQTPAAVRWVSYEPALGPINFTEAMAGLEGLDWVVAGGESGKGARGHNADWFRNARDECVEKNIRFLFKQWGAFDEHGERVGKHKSGRLLDGRTWDEYPV